MNRLKVDFSWIHKQNYFNMDLKEIQNRNYNATVRRGLITPSTEKTEFVEKLKEEVREFESEVDLPFFNDTTREQEELADIVLVCFAYATHFKFDLLEAMAKKVLYNEKRL